MTPAIRPAAAVLALGLLAGACGTSTPQAAPATTVAPTTTTAAPTTTSTTAPTTTTTVAVDDRAWPVPDWETTTPEAAGLDPVVLAALAADAEAAGSQCLLVTHAGRIVSEWTFGDTDARTEREAFSVTKSITAALVGIAVDRGLLSLDDPAADYIPAWRGTPAEAVTVANLVSNDSGRFHDNRTDYVEMAVLAPDKTAFSIALDQEHEPGTVWVYNNAAIQTLEAVLEAATGEDVGEFAERELFAPLGMATTIIRDLAGNTLTFMGAQASCRDLARFGLLHLRDGEWAGEQILSAEWVRAATSPSTDLNANYGYLWWLFPEDGPDDMYAALGLGGQVVAVYPESELVVVRLGNPAGSGGATFGVEDVIPAMRDALGAR